MTEYFKWDGSRPALLVVRSRPSLADVGLVTVRITAVFRREFYPLDGGSVRGSVVCVAASGEFRTQQPAELEWRSTPRPQKFTTSRKSRHGSATGLTPSIERESVDGSKTTAQFIGLRKSEGQETEHEYTYEDSALLLSGPSAQSLEWSLVAPPKALRAHLEGEQDLVFDVRSREPLEAFPKTIRARFKITDYRILGPGGGELSPVNAWLFRIFAALREEDLPRVDPFEVELDMPLAAMPTAASPPDQLERVDDLASRRAARRGQKQG